MPKSTSLKSSAAITRRQFARSAAVAAAGAALLSRDAPAQSQPAPPQPGAKLAPEARSEAEAKIQNILRKYGSRLSPAEQADVRRLVLQNQESLEQLRAYPLVNSDQPALVLRAAAES